MTKQTSTAGRPLAGTALVVVVATLLLFGPAPSASAHDELLTSSPTAGSVVTAPPTDISFTFAGRITPQFVTVTLSVDGQPARQLQTHVDQDVVVAAPPTEATSRQHWRVAYRVVSSDGHPVTGQIEFTVTPGAASHPAPTGHSTTPFSETRTATGQGSGRHDGHDASNSTDTGAERPSRWVVVAIAAGVAILITGGAVSQIRRRRARRPNS